MKEKNQLIARNASDRHTGAVCTTNPVNYVQLVNAFIVEYLLTKFHFTYNPHYELCTDMRVHTLRAIFG